MTATVVSPPRPSVAARRARVAVAAVFFTNGAIFANLLPRYPAIKEELDLTNAAFGLAVAAFPLGALIFGLTAGALIRRFRSSRVAVAGTIVTSLGILLAGIAPGWGLLAAGMFLAGTADSITDVAQNSHGLRVQRLYRRSILNSFHAVWCAGAVLGSIMGAAAAELGVPSAVHLVASAVLFSAVALVCYRSMLPGDDHAEDAAPGAAGAVGDAAAGAELDSDSSIAGATADAGAGRGGALAKYGILAALVLIAASGGLVEDAGSSWAAIYLSGSLEASAFTAGLGFVALQGMQFVGRMLGDGLVDRFGQRAVARAGGLLVLVGMGLALAFPSIPGTIVGFGAAGLGIATLIPAAMHAADEVPGFRRGSGLTIVSWLLRLGFLFSPPVVGAIADAASLRAGLVVVPLTGVIVLLSAGVLSTRTRRAAKAD
ncbi:MFS transporter [Microbacteriaceae bacterium 4G12]